MERTTGLWLEPEVATKVVRVLAEERIDGSPFCGLCPKDVTGSDW